MEYWYANPIRNQSKSESDRIHSDFGFSRIGKVVSKSGRLGLDVDWQIQKYAKLVIHDIT